MKIVIFNGSLSTQTFIKRMVGSLATYNITVYVAGFSSRRTPASKSEYHKINLGNKANLILLSIRIIITFLSAFFKNPNKVISHIKYLFRNKLNFTNLINFHVVNSILSINPDILHIQWANHINYFQFFLDVPESAGPKIIVSLRGRLVNISPRVDSKIAELYQKTFPKIDGFHAVSKAIALNAIEFGALEDKVKIIYSGLNVVKFKPFQKKEWAMSTPIKIISVGRSHWLKGNHLALDGLYALVAKGYNIKYTIIIPGVTDEILFHVKDLQLGSFVEILTGLMQNEIFGKMSEADIFLLPSIEEGIANVVLEAMAIGLPVVSSDCGGMPEIVCNDETGFLFKNRNVINMVDQIERLINASVELRASLAKSARQKLEQQHNFDKLGFEFNEFYQSLCE